MKFAKLSLILLGSLTLFTAPIEAKKPHQYHKMTHQMSHEQIQLYTHTPTQLPVEKIADSDTAPSLATEAVKAYGLYYLVSFYTVLTHEYGHAIAAKLLFGVNSTISLFPTLLGVEGYAAYHGGISPKGLKSAAVSAAGPLFGAATGYGILKLYNILSEYFDKSKPIKDAIKDGIKKPLFNTDQSLKLQIAVGLTSFNNLCNLLPIIEDNFVTDGACILYALT
jgi:Peptidase M50B-like